MRSAVNRLLCAVLGAGVALAGADRAAAAETLALKRVMLSTGGVGYFEHEAMIEGDARLELEVRLDQVDDVLKSIVVYDDRGGVGSFSLPGREPLAQIFRDLPFGPGALASPVVLLNALQGAEVSVAGARTLTGRLIRVVPEAVRLPDGAGTVTRHRLSLWTGQGIRHLLFEDAESIQFLDRRLQAQVERALTAIAAHRVRDKRTLTVAIEGAGRRAVRVAYVVGAPLWKATYRLTLPAEGESATGALQGWAVIENMSGHDWRDVELTLLSGNPVTFRQALYSAYYVHRPEVPVEVLGRILPRPDEGVIVSGQKRLKKVGKLGRMKLEEEARERDAAVARKAMAEDAAPGLAALQSLAPQSLAPQSLAMALPARAAVSEEAATQVVFRLPGTVSVEAGHSLLVAIVESEVPARRLSLYQPRIHSSHPLAAVALTNRSGSGLPPGVLTLYETSGESGRTAYVGDARLATLPLGEERLLSFALDQKTHVGREVRDGRRIVKATINRGVLRLTVAQSQTTEYLLKAPTDEDRLVLIEVPRRAGWKLVAPAREEVALTDSHYRIERRIAKGGEDSFEVTLERPLVETVRIASLPPERMLGYARSNELSQEVRDAFARMAALQGELGRHQRRLEELEAKRKKIFEEQTRMRNNMARVPRDSDIYRRYLDKLDAQETELERLAATSEKTLALKAKAATALSHFIANLDL